MYYTCTLFHLPWLLLPYASTDLYYKTVHRFRKYEMLILLALITCRLLVAQTLPFLVYAANGPAPLIW